VASVLKKTAYSAVAQDVPPLPEKETPFADVDYEVYKHLLTKSSMWNLISQV